MSCLRVTRSWTLSTLRAAGPQTWTSAWPRKATLESIAALYADSVLRLPRPGVPRCADRAPDYLRRVFAEESDITCRFGEPVVSASPGRQSSGGELGRGRQTVTLAGVTMLRFDDEGKVVDHRDYWNQDEGRIEPYAGW